MAIFRPVFRTGEGLKVLLYVQLKGNSSPKSFFVYRPTFSKEESGRNRRARSEQERVKRAPRDCSHSRSAPCIPRLAYHTGTHLRART